EVLPGRSNVRVGDEDRTYGVRAGAHVLRVRSAREVFGRPGEIGQRLDEPALVERSRPNGVRGERAPRTAEAHGVPLPVGAGRTAPRAGVDEVEASVTVDVLQVTRVGPARGLGEPASWKGQDL